MEDGGRTEGGWRMDVEGMEDGGGMERGWADRRMGTVILDTPRGGGSE